MPSNLTRYNLDLTGINRNNYIFKEPYTLKASKVRALIPLYGLFYSDSVVITDGDTGRTLVRGDDYLCVELHQELTAITGKEVSAVILITNQTLGSTGTITRQIVGGNFQYDSTSIGNLYELAINDNRPVDWSKISNKPTGFPTTAHRHLLDDLFGFEAVVAAIERLRSALMLSNNPAYEYLVDWIVARYDVIFDHVRDKNNPHEVSKEQVGLSLLENLSTFLTTDVDEAIRTSNKYKKYVTHESLDYLLATPSKGKSYLLHFEKTINKDSMIISVVLENQEVTTNDLFSIECLTDSGNPAVCTLLTTRFKHGFARFDFAFEGEIIPDDRRRMRVFDMEGRLVALRDVPRIDLIRNSKKEQDRVKSIFDIQASQSKDPIQLSAKSLYYAEAYIGDASQRIARGMRHGRKLPFAMYSMTESLYDLRNVTKPTNASKTFFNGNTTRSVS